MEPTPESAAPTVRRDGPNIRWLLLQAAALVVVVAGLRAAAPFLLPLLLALFLALLSFPIVTWLCRRGVRLPLAVIATVLTEMGLLLIAGLVLSGALNELARASPGYATQMVEKTRALIETLQAQGIDISGWFDIENLDPASLFDFAQGILRGTVKGVASFVSLFTLVLVILICVLFEGAAMPDKLVRAFGIGGRRSDFLANVTRQIQRYLGFKTLISLMTGTLLGLWVWALDVPFPLVWGMVAFVLNFIPAIGSIIAAIPAVLITLIQHGLGHAALVAVGYLAVNFLFGNLLEPHLMGRSFGLSTLVVFLSLIFWGWLWGPLGMLLSVPLTMVIKITLEETEQLRWVAVLLGPGGRPGPSAARK